MLNRTYPSALISAEQLHASLDDPQLVILDASFFLPKQNRDAFAEFQQTHLPQALFFDIDKVADQASSLPHMLPSAAEFSTSVAAMGINNRSNIVVYDSNAFMASARVWWMFRVFGHQQIRVLDGGIGAWSTSGFAYTTKQALPITAATLTTNYHPELVFDLGGMHTLVTDPAKPSDIQTQIIDARSAARFAGQETELRAGVRSGHIPGSTNLPYSLLIEHDKTLKPALELAQIFQEKNIHGNRPIVTSCGSGVTAAILALALYEIGVKDVPVYDGSWTEWGAKENTPIATTV